MLVATNIQWDYEGYDDFILPTEIGLPDGITDKDEISDYLSDVTGFCHKGFELEIVLEVEVADRRRYEQLNQNH